MPASMVASLWGRADGALQPSEAFFGVRWSGRARRRGPDRGSAVRMLRATVPPARARSSRRRTAGDILAPQGTGCRRQRPPHVDCGGASGSPAHRGPADATVIRAAEHGALAALRVDA